jgi:hypothetical protein
LAILTLALRLPGQTNAPARLALISESSDASTAADVLTSELSSNPKIQLLERNEIEKIYREQGLSAANKDYLKLGQILGADGLLLMETVKEGTNQFLNVRLIAVKPGVVLAGEKFVWPVKDAAEWSAAFARHLDLFFPKLAVLVKDAIPISVVNLRSAVSSDEAQETERQLKFPDDNHDGHVDLEELETFLKQQTRSGLRSRRMPGAASFNQMRMDPNQPVDPRQMFKAAVESYWQNPGSVTNQPPFGNRIPGAGFVPNRTPQGATQ